MMVVPAMPLQLEGGIAEDGSSDLRDSKKSCSGAGCVAALSVVPLPEWDDSSSIIILFSELAHTIGTACSERAALQVCVMFELVSDSYQPESGCALI
jgi:hypothetical protein